MLEKRIVEECWRRLLSYVVEGVGEELYSEVLPRSVGD